MTRVKRWIFHPSSGPARIARELGQNGSVWCSAPSAVANILNAPWRTVSELLGARPARIEIARVVHHGRPQERVSKKSVRAVARPQTTDRASASLYIANGVEAQLHTDEHIGQFPPIQIWCCVQPAASGGVNQLVDTWRVLSDVEKVDRDLFCRLFDSPRPFQFTVGDLNRPTFVLERGALVCSHPAYPADDDVVGQRFDALVRGASRTEVRLDAGDILVNHNHRVLHGRSGFTDPRRELLRVHVWLTRPLPAPARWVAAARHAIDRPGGWGTGRDSANPREPEALRRLSFVLEEQQLVHDLPVTLDFSRRIGLPYSQVTLWRERALDAALAVLERDLEAEAGARPAARAKASPKRRRA